MLKEGEEQRMHVSIRLVGTVLLGIASSLNVQHPKFKNHRDWVPFPINPDISNFSKHVRLMMQSRRLLTLEEQYQIMVRLDHFYQTDKFKLSEYELLAYTLLTNTLDSGLILEFGVAHGYSANLTGHFLKKSQTLNAFDTFEGLPEDRKEHMSNGTLAVNGTLAANGTLAEPGAKPPPIGRNIKLHKGLFNETIPLFLAQHPYTRLTFANIDCDLYTSTIDVLNLLYGRLQRGSILHFHDVVFALPEQNPGEELMALHTVVNRFHNFIRFDFLNVTGTFQKAAVLRVRRV